MSPSVPSAQAATPSAKKKKKKKLTMPWATVITGIITAGIGAGVTYVASSGASTATPTPSPSASLVVPAVLTIDQPPSADITWKDNYYGTALNLQPGQLVWIFGQVVTQGKPSTKVYPQIGPCAVDYTKHKWSCEAEYMGKKPPTVDNKTYEVCAAIIDSNMAHAIVSALSAGQQGYSLPLSQLPFIHDGTPSCMSVRRT
jgi:hypothetical protein